MPLASLIRPELVFAQIRGSGPADVLRFFARQIASCERLAEADVLKGLEERESLGSTGIGGAVAIPHCRVKGLREAILAVGVSPAGVPYEAADGKPVRLFFVIVSPKSDPKQNLRFLSAISRWVRQDGNVEKVVALESADDILAALQDVPTP